MVFDTDEHCKPEPPSSPWPKCGRPFKKDGTVTAGNASGINDGAAFFVLAEAGLAQAARL